MHSNIYPPIYIDKTANFKEKNIIRAAYTFEQAKNSYDRCDVAKARD